MHAVIALVLTTKLTKKVLPMNFLSFLVYQYTVLSSHAVDGHQMYSGGLVIGKSLTIGIEISPTPPLFFTGGQKVQNLASFSTSLNFELPAFENAARYPNSETDFLCSHDSRPMSLPSLKLGLRTPENHLSVVPHPLKLHGENMLNVLQLPVCVCVCGRKKCSKYWRPRDKSRKLR